ncbi:MAG: SDR family oxidoreductase [Caldilineaceae bacterium]
MTTYLVTGGAGFIGSNVVRALLQRGERVRVLDNFSTGRRCNLQDICHRIELIEGDLRSPELCRQAVQGVDFVLHHGAMPSVQRSVQDPYTSHDTNANATLNLLLAARDAQVKRFVYASSSSIYGDSPTLPKCETMIPKPKSPYATAKLAGEHYCRIFYELYGLETVCLRYFNVFGPRQDPASHYSAVIPLFIRHMVAGQAPTIYGDGRQSRDFTFVANNIAANLLATTAMDAAGKVYNIACGERYTLLDLVAALNELLGTHITPTFSASRKGDVHHSLADISHAQAELGYTVQADFLQGLAQTVAWYQTDSNIA